MTQRRRGIFASFADGYRRGRAQHGGSHHVRRGYRRSFIERQDAAYHRDKHRRHAMKHTGRMIFGGVLFILLLCMCGNFFGLW